jgi:PST family polysaccharide transporter
MINKIKNKFKSEDNKRLVSNFVSLSVLEGVNYILPLITLPYLVRVVGVEYFGLLAFATATVTYFNIFTDYGFNLTATREISIHRDNKEKVIEIFSSVMTIKIILMFISFLLLTILVFSFEKFSKDALIYFLTFGTVIGQVFFPVWFFQGMEKMKYITYLNILSKVIFTIAIFIFVQQKSDYYMVPFFTSIGFIVAGVWSLYLVKKKFKIEFRIQTKTTIIEYLIDGWHIFLSRIAVVFYTSSNIFILGLFANNTMIGYYSIAEKIIFVVINMASILTRVLFPYFSKIWQQNKNIYYIKFNFIFKLLIGIMILFSFIIYMFSNKLVYLVSGSVIEETVIVLKILAFAVVLFPMGSLFTESFVSQNKNSYVTKVTIYTSIVNLILVFPLVYMHGIYGLAFTVVIVQIFQFVLNYFYFLKLKRINNICVV